MFYTFFFQIIYNIRQTTRQVNLIMPKWLSIYAARHINIPYNSAIKKAFPLPAN